MKAKSFFNLFGKSIIDLPKNPVLFLPGIFLWIFFFAINKAGLKTAPLLTNTFANIGWVFFITLVNFIVVSFIFGAAINLSLRTVKKTKENFLSMAKKYFLSNFLILLFIFLIYNILINGSLFLYTKLMLYLLNYFEIPLLLFKTIAFLISAFWICSVLLFLIYSNFFAVIKYQKVREAVKSSINFTRAHYLDTLALSVIIFVTFFLLSKIPPNFSDAINYLIMIPFYTLLIVKFIMKNDIRN